jgi:hypothetical protein
MDDLKRNARAVPKNRPGVVTYLKSPGLTPAGENGGSRLVGRDRVTNPDNQPSTKPLPFATLHSSVDRQPIRTCWPG